MSQTQLKQHISKIVLHEEGFRDGGIDQRNTKNTNSGLCNIRKTNTDCDYRQKVVQTKSNMTGKHTQQCKVSGLK